MATSFEPIFPDAVSAGVSAGISAGASGGPSWISALSARDGFAADPRYGAAPDAPRPGDPELEKALDDAFAAGAKQAREAALAQMAERDGALEKLRLSVSRLDEELQEKLANKLAETVAALCEATLAPMALDREALERRCINAARLLGDSLMDSTLRLHPDDIDLLGREFSATWHMSPDDHLTRGTIRFETPEGAVIDGPDEWRAALREALGLC